MDISVNYLAVLLAAVSSMVVGATWYSRGVFGNRWMKLAKVKMDKKFSGSEQAVMYGMTFVASLITAYVLAHVTFLSNNYFHYGLLQSALSTAFWVWLGFTAARILTHDIFEGRPKMLTALNAAHELVTFMVMGLIIGYMGV
jgi:hypothetical protein